MQDRALALLKRAVTMVVVPTAKLLARLFGFRPLPPALPVAIYSPVLVCLRVWSPSVEAPSISLRTLAPQLQPRAPTV